MVEKKIKLTCNELDRVQLIEGKYHSAILIGDEISEFVKKLVITIDLPDFAVKMPGLSTYKTISGGVLPVTGTCEQKDNSLVIIPSLWFRKSKPYIVLVLITDKPIRLPISITITYESSTLPIPLPEKYEFKLDFPYFKFTVHNNGTVHRSDMVLV
jgi:hypothetical protein